MSEVCYRVDTIECAGRSRTDLAGITVIPDGVEHVLVRIVIAGDQHKIPVFFGQPVLDTQAFVDAGGFDFDDLVALNLEVGRLDKPVD